MKSLNHLFKMNTDKQTNSYTMTELTESRGRVRKQTSRPTFKLFLKITVSCLLCHQKISFTALSTVFLAESLR